MANRYWVGGTGTWDTTTTTNWSTASGGAGGASVPTAADSVFFDQAGTYTVTQTGALTCLDITVSAGVVTFATGTTPTLAISGSMSLLAGTVWSSTGAITFNATSTGKTITTNGVTISAAITFNGVGGGWTLGSAWTSSGGWTIVAGAVSTANYSVTCSLLTNSGSLTRSLSLGSSTVSIGSLNWNTTAGFTFNTGTSQINITFSGTTNFNTGGYTYYNVKLNPTSFGTGNFNLSATFNNLELVVPSTGNFQLYGFAANQTINGTLTVSGSSAIGRAFLRSNTLGTIRTLTCAAVSIPDCDFRDITLAGAAAGASPTRAGDCGGNSGITFPAAKTVYWNLAGVQNWSATGWATSSGGSPAINNFPLAQDTAVFDNTGSVTGTITIDASWNIGTVDMSARTSAMTLTAGATTTPSIYGNWINGSGISTTGSGPILVFTKRGGTQTITSAGKTISFGITINNIGGTVQLSDAFTLSNALTLTNGTLDLNGKTATLSTFGTATGTKNLTFNGSTLIITSASSAAFNNVSPTGFTTTAGTGTGTISMTSTGTKTFTGGGSTFNCTLNSGGAGALTISGSNTFNNITNTVQPTTFNFTSGTTTTVTNFNVSGTSGSLVTLKASTAGTQFTISKSSGIVSSDYLSITDSAATGGATWYAGANSTNVSNNSGWIFTAPPVTTNTGSFFLVL